MVKVKLFTHTDLDGVGCAILANHAFGKENVDVEYCDYDKIDEKVAFFIFSESINNYGLVLITDISVNETIAQLINETINSMTYYDDVRQKPRKLLLIDHHATASWLNKYWWASVESVKANTKTAGTSLLLDFVINEGYLKNVAGRDLPWLESFAEQVRRWDTWDWFDVYKEEYSKRLNNLLYLIGRDKFVNRFTSNLNWHFTESENLVLEIEEESIKKYIEKASQNIIRTKLAGYENVGVVFAERYTSELGSVLCNNNTDLDFIVIINMAGGTLSFRGIRDSIDLGKEVASKFGGGGHAKSAGARFNKESKSQIINLILKEE